MEGGLGALIAFKKKYFLIQAVDLGEKVALMKLMENKFKDKCPLTFFHMLYVA